MIGALLFVNSRGDVVLSRLFRDGFSVRGAAETFRNELISTKRVDRCPVNIVGGICFIHVRFRDLYLVLASRDNMNCVVALQYATRLLQICFEYFERVDETALKQNFVTIQELVDESMDFGYPMTTELDVLKSYITFYGINANVIRKPAEVTRVTAKAMGPLPWREEGLIYRVNEVFLDVFEDVNMLIARDGAILQSEVVGRVAMKAFLSGMPECELVIKGGAGEDEPVPPAPPCLGISALRPRNHLGMLENVQFHACVRLERFDVDGVITFIPPDGECTIMRYRSVRQIEPPMRVMESEVREVSKTRMEIRFVLKSTFPEKRVATDIVVRIPCPHNTAHARLNVSSGKAQYDPIHHAIVWNVRKMVGGSELTFNAEISLLAATLAESEQLWSRPPIALEFRCTELALTGTRVEQLRVDEPSIGYGATKWVRYFTSGGQYQCRI